ncbi:TetR/AcrR family transcriptional regulator [Pseudonocardia sp. KRD291]|uniref:TetR/AcrR family transcriptional regulator n=1 Tax=Pseudonocardia sp. KRD291 TaxID=2792007 RepID=UPI001C5C39C4|nr:TetR/AcrR family transcriptional regulator [Pseudonocardia sp. KRD291]MBW0102545.1 TetR/AcrR family transcriptional regulator [Pseudonocardia sp. KRD291]
MSRLGMNAITQRSTATKATYYNRFGSKDDLYAACLRREAERMRAHLVTAYESADVLGVSEQLEGDMLAFFRHAATNPAGFTLLFGPEAAGPAARIRQSLLDAIREEVARRVRRTLDAHHPHASASADMIAAMIIGVAVHGTYQAVVVEPTSPERAGAMASSFLIAAWRNMDPEVLVDTP